MGTHPTFSSSGPSASYQPKTTDESDSTIAGVVVPHVNVQGPVLGTLTDASTPDPSASGASTSLVSLLRGIAANGFALLGRLPASLGPKAKASALAVTTATDDPVLAAVAATGPGSSAFAITASDSANFGTAARSIYVGAAGDVVVVVPGGTAITFKAAPAGSILPVQAIRVNATNTTASSLVGLV